MTGGNPNKGKHSSSSSASKKSRWESGNNQPKPTTNTTPSTNTTPTTDTKPSNTKPSSSTPKSDPSSKPGPSRSLPDPTGGPGLLPAPGSTPPFAGAPLHFGSDPAGLGGGPPPPPAYGFHMLERRTIFLADGSVRSYFALPPDYQDFPRDGRGPPIDDRFLPFGGPGGPGGLGGPGGIRDPRDPRDPREIELAARLGFDKHFPPGGRLSPESAFRRDRERERDELLGRAGGGGGQNDYWNSLGLDGRPEGSLKRKYGEGDERDLRDGRDRDGRDGRDRDGRDLRGEELARQRQQLLQWGNSSSDPNGFPSGSGGERGERGERERGGRGSFFGGTSSPFQRDMSDSGRGGEDMRLTKHMRIGGDYDLGGGRGDGEDVRDADVDPQALKKAFLRYVKTIHENATQKNNYLEDGKGGPVSCLACGRGSKDFPDMHGLIMHAYNFQSSDLHVDHRGFHKALCVLMGWSYKKVPDNSKAYRSLPADEAEANKDDLILWPPIVIIRNTNTGKGKEGRMEGVGNKVMDNILKEEAIKRKSFLGTCFVCKEEGHRARDCPVEKMVGHKHSSEPTSDLDRQRHAPGGDSRVLLDDDAIGQVLKDLGFASGKAKSLYGKEGHLGITLVKFTGNQPGLKEAVRLGDYFEKENRGRKGWARAQPSQSERDDEGNPNLVKVDEKTGKKKRIFYGYLATAGDLEEVDVDTRKKANIESKKESK